MVGNNLNKIIFPFFNSVKVPISAGGSSDSLRLNCLYDSVTLEISGGGTGMIYVEGCINILNADGSTKTDAQCSWTKMSMMDMKTMSIVDVIKGDGIYSITTSGLNRIRVTIESISSPITVVGVAGV